MKTYAQTDFWQFCLFSAEKKGHKTEDGQAIPILASNKVKYKFKKGKENEKRIISRKIIRVKKSHGKKRWGGEYFWLCR